jgi:hypothetical protein
MTAIHFGNVRLASVSLIECKKVLLCCSNGSADTCFTEITPFAFQSGTPWVMREPNLSHFPVMYSMTGLRICGN